MIHHFYWAFIEAYQTNVLEGESPTFTLICHSVKIVDFKDKSNTKNIYKRQM